MSITTSSGILKLSIINNVCRDSFHRIFVFVLPLFFILVDLFNWAPYFEEERLEWLKPKKPVHEQDDGVILAMCITGTSSRDSLVSWIRFLQKSNPNLEQIPVIFTLRTEGQETALVKQSASGPSS
jgi:hypothetical protein